MNALNLSFQILNLVFGGGEMVEQRALMETRQDITPLFVMPKGGSLVKAPILDSILSHMRHFDDLYLFYSEGLEAVVGNEVVARDTKVVIDSSHPLRVFLNTNDADKFDWVYRYIVERGIIPIQMFGDAEQWMSRLQPSTTRSLLYINGAFIKAQTPELANYLKSLLPYSTIIMVVIDPYKSRATRNPKSRAFSYGHNMTEYIESFNRLCRYKTTFIPYGVNRYLAVI